MRELSSGYQFIAFGVPHDHPPLCGGQLQPRELEVLVLQARYVEESKESKARQGLRMESTHCRGLSIQRPGAERRCANPGPETLEGAEGRRPPHRRRVFVRC